jgi:ribosomal protein S18 acetylase RimI-like enzyme
VFVRTAGERDLPAVRSLLAETWHATYDAIYGAGRVAGIVDEWHSIRALKAQLDRPFSEFLVADDGTRLGGMAFASSGDEGATVSLHQLYIRPAHQGRGIGGMLLDEIIGSFHDANRVRLEVEAANARAIAFYLSQGFSEVGRTENCGREGSGIPALLMERLLANPLP